MGLLLGAAMALLLAAASAQAADAVSYNVKIEAPKPLDELLQNNLDLVRFRGNPRTDQDQLRRLVHDAPEQARTLVATAGFYTPVISARLDSGAVPPSVTVHVEPGEPVLVGSVEIGLQGFADTQQNSVSAFDPVALKASWALKEGEVFRQGEWEAAKRNLLRQVVQTRYPRAQLSESLATVDPDTHRVALRVVLDSGPEMRFGALRIEGVKRYPSSIISNLNTIKPGDYYSESALQALQSRLQDTGYYSSVEVSADMSSVLDEQLDAAKTSQPAAPASTAAKPDQADDASPVNPVAAASATTATDTSTDTAATAGEATTAATTTATSTGNTTAAATPAPAVAATMAPLPLVVRVVENKEKNVSAGLGYSSNTGNRAQLNYDDLSVFGLKFKSALTLETKQQTATAAFYFPTTPDGYNDSVGANFVRADVAGEVTSTTTVFGKRSWGSNLLERTLTLEHVREERSVDDVKQDGSKALALTYGLTKRHLDNLLFPTKGYVIAGTLGAAPVPILTDEPFIRSTAKFVTYLPVGARSTVVLRGEAGAVLSKEKSGIPSVYLFRAGGDQSVRGYAYQELGVKDGDATVGGRYLLTGSAEYQYWFKPTWGAATFYDAGNAADNLKALAPKSGYGVGVRYRSPVGPINVDVAYGHATKKIRLHFSLGFTF